jgi:hypothetical protein
MDRTPVSTAIRRVRRDRRLGEGAKVCLLCGYADPISLIPVGPAWIRSHKEAMPRSLFEDDQSAGIWL